MTQIDFRLFCPISRLTTNLRDLLKESHVRQSPIIVTQKGRPTAVVLTVDSYVSLTHQARLSDPVFVPSENDPHEGRAS